MDRSSSVSQISPTDPTGPTGPPGPTGPTNQVSISASVAALWKPLHTALLELLGPLGEVTYSKEVIRCSKAGVISEGPDTLSLTDLTILKTDDDGRTVSTTKKSDRVLFTGSGDRANNNPGNLIQLGLVRRASDVCHPNGEFISRPALIKKSKPSPIAKTIKAFLKKSGFILVENRSGKLHVLDFNHRTNYAGKFNRDFLHARIQEQFRLFARCKKKLIEQSKVAPKEPEAESVAHQDTVSTKPSSRKRPIEQILLHPEQAVADSPMVQRPGREPRRDGNQEIDKADIVEDYIG